MPDKPSTTDPEQRRRDTERSRYQSGLPPESEKTAKPAPKRPPKPAGAEDKKADRPSG